MRKDSGESLSSNEAKRVQTSYSKSVEEMIHELAIYCDDGIQVTEEEVK